MISVKNLWKKVTRATARENTPPNHWSQTAVVYEIYPMSFKDSKRDGVGDLQGIIEKLDYLNDGTENSLGINAIWITPIYESPMADFGYDISDYRTIKPLFGNLAIFDKLVKEAHKRNIKIIMDFVSNHTSVDHPWFIESRSSKDNPKRDWYIWRDPKLSGETPNNWISVFGGPAWEYDTVTGQYYLHTFLRDQPDLNWRNPEVKKAMLSILEFWIDHGVDGFRVDAVEHILKDAQFRDEPANPRYKAGIDKPYEALSHIYTKRMEGLIDTTQMLCEFLSTHKNIFIVTEAYVETDELARIYNICGQKSLIPFNFKLTYLPWNARDYKQFIDEFDSKLSLRNMPNYVFGNHDLPRTATRLGQGGARGAALLLFTLRGIPFIYYGEELGMENSSIPREKVMDSAEKQTPGFNIGRDPERTPMQWDATTHAGFSETRSWLPVGKNHTTHNVRDEEKDPYSMLSLYKKLIHLRKKSLELLYGKYVPRESTSTDVFSFIREHGDGKSLIVLNFGSSYVNEPLPFTSLQVTLNTRLDHTPGKVITDKTITLRPHEGYIFKIITEPPHSHKNI